MYTTQSLQLGYNGLRAEYNGSGVYEPQYSNGLSVYDRDPIKLTIDGSPATALAADTVTLTANLGPQATEPAGSPHPRGP